MAGTDVLKHSIIAQVTALIVGGLMLVSLLLVLALQTPISRPLFKTALAENAGNLSELTWLIEKGPPEFETFVLSAYNGGGRFAQVTDNAPSALKASLDFQQILEGAESDVSHRFGGRAIHFEQIGARELFVEGRAAGMDHVFVAAALFVVIPLEDGRHLNIWLAPSLAFMKGVFPVFMIAMVLITVGLILSVALSFLFLRPIRRLEREAESVDFAMAGQGVTIAGPIELRRISKAFNRMHERLVGLLNERQHMMAAIAHDIRTGLTRVRLRLDAPNALSQADLEHDLGQVETLISDMMAYARADDPNGPRELIRLGSFVQDLATKSPYGARFENQCCTDIENIQLVADPVSLRRLFDNLLENANRYGHGEIAIVMSDDAHDIMVAINDNGPGIPEDDLETVFQPFRRLEGSRNRESGGSGLGLGIARSIARAHGATITLKNGATGGLCAQVQFPRTIFA
jgi:signal transduction histidine kinase